VSQWFCLYFSLSVIFFFFCLKVKRVSELREKRREGREGRGERERERTLKVLGEIR